jgi:hypothetical protein
MSSYTLEPVGFIRSTPKGRGEASRQGPEGAPDDWRGSRRSTRPTPRASGSRDRVEAKSSDGDDPEQHEEHKHDELRLLERRLGLCRREQYKLRLSSNQTLTK